MGPGAKLGISGDLVCDAAVAAGILGWQNAPMGWWCLKCLFPRNLRIRIDGCGTVAQPVLGLGCLQRFSLLLICAAAGCASTPEYPVDLLAFLDQPTITRQDVLMQLGPPSTEFEQSRVLSYRLSRCKNGHVMDTPTYLWKGVDCNLVLVFDDQDVVQRHRLIEIR